MPNKEKGILSFMGSIPVPFIDCDYVHYVGYETSEYIIFAVLLDYNLSDSDFCEGLRNAFVAGGNKIFFVGCDMSDKISYDIAILA